MNPEVYNFPDYIESYQYVRLETTPQSLIGNIDKLCSDLSLFFIFDKENNHVLCFSNKGQFLHKIGSKGRGPGEYIKIEDISVDYNKHQLCLLDLNGGKQLFYNYEGKLLYEQPLYYYYHQLEFLGNKEVLLTSYAHNEGYPAIDSHRLILATRNQAPLWRAFSYPSQLRENFHWEYAHPLSSYNGHVFFHYILSDTIWEITDHRCIARYVLKFPGRKPLYDIRKLNLLSDNDFSFNMHKNSFFEGNYVQNKNMFTFFITDKGPAITPLFYSKISGKVLYGFAFSKSMNSFLAKIMCNQPDYVAADNSLIKVLQPFDIFRILKFSEKTHQKVLMSSKDKELLRNMKEEDNPVLLVVKMKTF